MQSKPVVSVSRYSPGAKHQANRNQTSYLTWIVIGCLGVFFLGLKIVGDRMVVEGERRMQVAQDPWYDRGYKKGLVMGQAERNNDSAPDVDVAFAICAAKDPSDAMWIDFQTGRWKVMPYYEIKDELPKRGTNGFGQFRKGFDVGYAAGYVAR